MGMIKRNSRRENRRLMYFPNERWDLTAGIGESVDEFET